MNFWNMFLFYNSFGYNIENFKKNILKEYVRYSNVLPRYYTINETLWQEGLLIDFLQKKIIDKWTKKFLIFTAYLFNERSLFDKIVRFYLDLIIWPMHKLSIFEYNNLANTISIILIFFISLFFIFSFFYYISILL